MRLLRGGAGGSVGAGGGIVAGVAVTVGAVFAGGFPAPQGTCFADRTVAAGFVAGAALAADLGDPHGTCFVKSFAGLAGGGFSGDDIPA
jgi:hypothetical protein